MRILVAGATGTIGRPAVGLLVAGGHEVVGLTRTETGRAALERAGVRGVVGNVLDEARVAAVFEDVKPEAVVHLLTALPPGGPLRPKDLLPTDRLRTAGTASLLRAATASGVRRLVAESFVAVYGSSPRGEALTEDGELPPAGRGPLSATVAALRSMEAQLQAASSAGQLETVVLRFGFFYGREVPSTRAFVAQAQARRLFSPRALPGLASFVQIADAAAAVRLAVEHPAPSPVYNIADDEPMPFTEFLLRVTKAVGAAPPRSLPLWLVRLVAPVAAETGSARLGMSNARARRELGWQPRYPVVSASAVTDA